MHSHNDAYARVDCGHSAVVSSTGCHQCRECTSTGRILQSELVDAQGNRHPTTGTLVVGACHPQAAAGRIQPRLRLHHNCAHVYPLSVAATGAKHPLGSAHLTPLSRTRWPLVAVGATLGHHCSYCYQSARFAYWPVKCSLRLHHAAEACLMRQGTHYRSCSTGKKFRP